MWMSSSSGPCRRTCGDFSFLDMNREASELAAIMPSSPAELPQTHVWLVTSLLMSSAARP